MSQKNKASIPLLGRRRKKQTGFTLTELLVSLGILGIISVSSFMVFGQALTAWNKIVRRAKILERTRTTFTTISRDLNAAVISSWSDVYTDNTPMFYVNNDTLSYGAYSLDNDTIVFCSNNFHPRVFDPGCDYYNNDAGVVGEIKYEIMDLASGSYVSRTNSSMTNINMHELVRSYDCPADFLNMDDLANDTFDADIPIGLSIISMNIELYKADASYNYSWESNWTEVGSLPNAVKITLGIRKNYKKFFDNMTTANQPPEMILDYYYFMVELPSRERT